MWARCDDVFKATLYDGVYIFTGTHLKRVFVATVSQLFAAITLVYTYIFYSGLIQNVSEALSHITRCGISTTAPP